MSETQTINIDTDQFQSDLDDIREQFESLIREDINPMAREVEGIFTDLKQSIASELKEAVRDGQLTVNELVTSIVLDVAELASDRFIQEPLEALFSNILQGGFGGAASTGPSQISVGGSFPSGNNNSLLGRSTGQTASVLSSLLARAGRNA